MGMGVEVGVETPWVQGAGEGSLPCLFPNPLSGIDPWADTDSTPARAEPDVWAAPDFTASRWQHWAPHCSFGEL